MSERATYETVVGQRGYVYVDRETNMVMRIAAESVGMPPASGEGGADRHGLDSPTSAAGYCFVARRDPHDCGRFLDSQRSGVREYRKTGIPLSFREVI